MEILEEFDEPLTANGTYCSQISPEEYRSQSIAGTEVALTHLVEQISKDPRLITNTLKKRKIEELEAIEDEKGLFEWLRDKLFHLLNFGASEVHSPIGVHFEITHKSHAYP